MYLFALTGKFDSGFARSSLRRIAGLVFAAALALGTQSALAFDLVFVVPDLNPKFREIAESTISNLNLDAARDSQHQIVLASELKDDPAIGVDASEIVAIGEKALTVSLAHFGTGRIYGAVVPYHLAVELLGTTPETVDLRIIAAEQAPRRVARLTRIVLPGRNSICVFHSALNDDRVSQLDKAFESDSFDLMRISVPEDLKFLNILANRLDEIDALLAVPDPRGVNRLTARNVLRSTHRRQVPVIGYSREYVKSGALAAIYSTPAQYGKQLAKLIVDANESKPTGVRVLVRPDEFEISINKLVARTLGFELPSESEIKAAIQLEQ